MILNATFNNISAISVLLVGETLSHNVVLFQCDSNLALLKHTMRSTTVPNIAVPVKITILTILVSSKNSLGPSNRLFRLNIQKYSIHLSYYLNMFSSLCQILVVDLELLGPNRAVLTVA